MATASSRGGYVADPDNRACSTMLLEVDEDLVVPGLVLAELDYWCHERLSSEAWLTFPDDLP